MKSCKRFLHLSTFSDSNNFMIPVKSLLIMLKFKQHGLCYSHLKSASWFMLLTLDKSDVGVELGEIIEQTCTCTFSSTSRTCKTLFITLNLKSHGKCYSHLTSASWFMVLILDALVMVFATYTWRERRCLRYLHLTRASVFMVLTLDEGVGVYGTYI